MEFAISFITCVDATTGKRSLCGHEEDEKLSDDKEESNEQKVPSLPISSIVSSA
jgi:hypothetical protein